MSSNKVQDLFKDVPSTYERINHLLTFGMDIILRRAAVKEAVKQKGTHWLDVCSGTGETAVYLQKKAPEETQVFVADFSVPMMEAARSKKDAAPISFSAADVGALPYGDDTFDLITISFATRNINTSKKDFLNRLSEIRRVLKPGGIFVNVETSQPKNPLFRKLFHVYIRLVVQQIGGRISGSKAAYAYLAHTIPRFYNARELADLLRESGFNEVDFKKKLFGIAAIHFSRI